MDGWACAAGVATWPPRRHLPPAAGLGILASLSLVLYLVVTRTMPLAVAVVLASLYPVVPVMLAVLWLRERLSRPQWAGLGLALIAVCLIVGPDH
ncbi:EamA family transporter [Bordetella sp. 2513F-2]